VQPSLLAKVIAAAIVAIIVRLFLPSLLRARDHVQDFRERKRVTIAIVGFLIVVGLAIVALFVRGAER
jgi:hypothetical protein